MYEGSRRLWVVNGSGLCTKLDDEANGSHDHEADADRLTDLEELSPIGLRAAVDEVLAVPILEC